MDWIKLAEELRKITPDWEFHTHIEGGHMAHIRAFKDGMAYSVKYQGKYVMAEGVYPKEFLPIDPEKLPYSQVLASKDEAEIAAHIVGTFLPKYQRLFADISGRIASAIEQRYSLATQLEQDSGKFVRVYRMEEYPELGGHDGAIDVEASVRSGDLVYLDMVVPGDVAREIVRLVGMLSGGAHGNGPGSPNSDS